MADKAIGDLNFAPGTVDDSNTLFVVQQAGAAYKLSGHEFILALTTILDGHGGVQSIVKTSTVGLTDTYTVTYADQTTTTFTVTNGKGISGLTQYWAVNDSPTTVPTTFYSERQTMTSENRYLWGYVNYRYSDGTNYSTPKSVVGVYGDTGDAWYVWIRYAGQQPTSDADIGTTPDDWIGIYSGTSATAPTSYLEYQWFEFKGEKGDTGAASAITSQSVSYMESASGTVVPTGSWTSTIPSVTPGNFLWTRTILSFNDGTQVTSYSVSRYGIDGTGSVSTVNGVSPDSNGNVALGAGAIPTSDNTSVQTSLDSLRTELDSVAIYLTSVPLSATTGDIATVNYSGITANHVVSSISVAYPSAISGDITWSTTDGSLVLNGICAPATTADIVLLKKNN